MLYHLRYGYKRLKYGKPAKRTPLACLYERALPDKRLPFDQCDFLVADCEMSGLDPNTNALISIGWVRVSKGCIDYASRNHVLLHAPSGVGDSIKIHGLYDSQLAGAAPPSKALSLLAQQASNTVLVFHHAVLDLAFLNKSALENFGLPLSFPYIDTMLIEQKRLALQQKSGSLQLNLCRDRYGLPRAFAHNAMTDAIATAELFIAQCAYMQSGGSLQLNQLGVKVY